VILLFQHPAGLSRHTAAHGV